MKVYVLIQLSGNEIDYIENAYLDYEKALTFLQSECSDGLFLESVAYNYDVFGVLMHEYAPIFRTQKAYEYEGKAKVASIHWQLLEFDIKG